MPSGNGPCRVPTWCAPERSGAADGSDGAEGDAPVSPGRASRTASLEQAAAHSIGSKFLLATLTQFNMRLIALTALLGVVVGSARSWSTTAPIPERLQEHHGVLFGGKIYIAGGIDSTGQTTKVAYRYDPTRNTWQRVADLPEPRHHMPLLVVNDTLYAIGGFDGLRFTPKATLWIYRADKNTWEERAPLPAPRGATGAGVVSGKLVVVGGYGLNRALLDTTIVYDPRSNAWSNRAPIPTKR